MRARLIRYFDSMGGDNTEGMQAILLVAYIDADHFQTLPLRRESRQAQEGAQPRYVVDPHREGVYQTIPIPMSILVQDIPHQLNGSDCGVFSCKFADFVSRDKFVDFTQENMPYFRRRMVVEIVQKALIAQC